MILVLSDLVKIWRKSNLFAPYAYQYGQGLFVRQNELLGLGSEYICIKGRWFKTLSPSELCRSQSKDTGKYHYLYIQINFETGEYYIGKSNKTRWAEVKRYQGSGLRFKNEYNKHKDQFVRYFLTSCNTAEETERLESELVDKDLLEDEKCLNLVAGGGGTSRNYGFDAARIAKMRAYMKAHPERYAPMAARAKVLYRSGPTLELKARSRRIKETMADDKYRDMTRARIKRWIENHPDDYAESRIHNKACLKSPETRTKRRQSRELWKQTHPEEYKKWQEKLCLSRQSETAKAKRRASLKKWRDAHPEEYRAQMAKMVEIGMKKVRKAICRVDLNTGEVLETYASQHDAARWLVAVGLAKSLNCVTSISAVCRKAPCINGYGYRQNAYGFGWRFKSDSSL